MKVILKENLENLGHIGEVVKVAPGYARNYLIPKALAIEANERNTKAMEHARRHLEYKRSKTLEQAKQLAAKLEALALSVAHQAGEEGKLFGAVTNMELAELLKAKGFEIDRKKIVLAEPIKHVGDFTATVKIQPDVSATLKVTVTAA